MSNVFLDDTGRRHRVIMIVVPVLAVAAVVLGIAYAVTRDGKTGDTAAHAHPNATASSVTVPSGPLKLLKGSRTVQGVDVGYPHSTAGAVSAAAEYLTQIGGTLDIDRSRTIGGVIADPSFTEAADYFANGPVNTRKRLGLPTSGPVPGASIVFGPAAYQLRTPSSDSMIVLILGYLTTTTPDGQVTPRIAVVPMEMHWDTSDWKLLRPGISKDTDYSSLSVPPNTADATAKGWTELVP
jgi:hypothetical protein